jgi:DNA polymerase type B, organellar and viral
MERWATVEELAPAIFLVRLICRAGNHQLNSLRELHGIPALNGTRVQDVHQDMLDIGLPFRVNVRVVALTRRTDGDPAEPYPFAIPPIAINPAELHGLNSWPAFLNLLRARIGLVAHEMSLGADSSWTWVGLSSMELTYLALNNLAAFEPHLAQLRGGHASLELPALIMTKKCVVNILNKDNQCLRCCLMLADRKDKGEVDAHPQHWSKYISNHPANGKFPRGFAAKYRKCSLDLTMLSFEREAKLMDLDAVEQGNPGLGIYVYKWHTAKVKSLEQDFVVLARQPPKPLKVTFEVLLLLHDRHFCLITGWNRFASQRNFTIKPGGNTHNAAKICHRCFESFRLDAELEKHLSKCKGQFEEPPPLPRLPSTQIKHDKTRVYFTNHKSAFFHPIVVYADIETFFSEDQRDISTNTTSYGQNNSVASMGMHAVGSEGLAIPQEFQARIFVNDGGSNPFTECMRSLLRLALFWRYVRRTSKPLVMTREAWIVYNSTNHCDHCGVEFEGKVVKCKDHNHITGQFRATLCLECNAKATMPTGVKVMTHNGTGYDHHFYILGIAALKCIDESLATFTNAPQEWLEEGDKETKLKDFKVEVLAESSEKLRCIKFSKGFKSDLQIEFLDSLKFVKARLEDLMETQKKQHASDLSTGFQCMVNFHPLLKDLESGQLLTKLGQILQKLPFPYSQMRDQTFWARPALLEREAFYNDLTKKPMSEKSYAELRSLLETFQITTCRELHDAYLYNDILAFADCFETFRSKFHESSGLDPFHFLGLPGAAWNALLKNSEADVENITQESCNDQGALLMKYVDDNIRGGLSCAFVSHSKANNPRCPSYDSEAEHVWIKDFDANSLYPYCMAMPMPVGNYKLLGGSEHGNTREHALSFLQDLLDQYTPESGTGYMLVVRLEIPKDLHDHWDYAPAVNRSVSYKELSKRQQKMKRLKHLEGFHGEERAVRLAKLIQSPGYRKLVPDLSPQDHKAIHIEHAQELRKHGAQFTELYACFSFDQDLIFTEEIERLAAQRAATSDEALREIIKLTLNAPFGKTLEDKKRRKNFKVHTDLASFQRNASLKRTAEFRIQHYCEDDGSFLGTTTTHRKKQAVLDTPRMMGWAILEYAKMVMTRFHYGTMKPLFGDKLKLLYTDTDSMYYEIKWDMDPIDYIAKMDAQKPLEARVFDLSLVQRYKDSPLKNKLGCFKYEGAKTKKFPDKDDEIIEAVFPTSKSYIKRMSLEDPKRPDAQTLKIAQKGIPDGPVKEHFDTLELYKDTVFTNRRQTVQYNQFRSFDHVVTHCTTSKVALSAENDKVFQISPHQSRPLGHFRNSLEVVPPCPDWDLSDSEDVDAVSPVDPELGEEDLEESFGHDSDSDYDSCDESEE